MRIPLLPLHDPENDEHRSLNVKLASLRTVFALAARLDSQSLSDLERNQIDTKGTYLNG
jgi:hypothetical protein